jgi:hypothetical protein
VAFGSSLLSLVDFQVVEYIEFKGRSERLIMLNELMNELFQVTVSKDEEILQNDMKYSKMR